MKCSICKKEIVPEGLAAGYARLKNGRKICYDCCAERDKKDMRATGKAILYLTEIPVFKEDSERLGNCPIKCGEVTNWPRTLRFPLYKIYKGRHNIAKIRQDVYFDFEGTEWHGVCYGHYTQILHCKRNKTR